MVLHVFPIPIPLMNFLIANIQSPIHFTSISNVSIHSLFCLLLVKSGSKQNLDFVCFISFKPLSVTVPAPPPFSCYFFF